METGLLDRLSDRAGLGDDLETGSAVEKSNESLSDDLVVVDHQ